MCSMERDAVTGLPVPHLSFILRHFLPMAHNCESRQFIQENCDRNELLSKEAGIEILCSGSSVEGLNLPGLIDGLQGKSKRLVVRTSDIDYMYLLKNTIVCDTEQLDRIASKNGEKEMLEIYTDGIHPGYLQVRVHKCRPVRNKGMFVEKGDDYLYYDPEKVKQMFNVRISELEKANPDGIFERQGPALTCQLPSKQYMKENRLQYGDLVLFCICCTEWPKAAEEWKTRDRPANWPSPDTIQKVVEEGCHSVPVCHADSKEPHLEWRMSFSLAELTLMHCINRTQRQCYLLLKTLHNQALKEPKGLATYHLKTLFLHMCEVIPQEEWTPDNVAPCLMKMIDHLHTCLKEHKLPSYFIPENNLIDQIPADLCDELAERVLEIRANPLRSLFDFNKKSKWFFGPLWVDAIDLYKPILDDAKKSKSMGESYKVFFEEGLLNAYLHLIEHGAMMDEAMQVDHCQDPLNPAYTLPFDNALDILEDVARLHQKVIGEALDISQLVAMHPSGLRNFTDCLIGFYERFLYRYPDSPNRSFILGNLGCYYHIKYLRPLEPETKQLIKDKAIDVFQKCLVSGGSTGAFFDYALYLCEIKEKETAIALLQNIMETESGKVTLATIGENSYAGPEISTIDVTFQQIANKQTTIMVFSYAAAAYLLVKLLEDEDERKDTITKLKAQCVLLEAKFHADKRLQVGNAFVLLGYACELAGQVQDAKEAQEMAAKLLSADQLPALHVRPNKQSHRLGLTKL